MTRPNPFLRAERRMTAPASFSCPYCNSQVSPPGVRSGQRIVCRRCGESFVYQGPDTEGEAPPEAPQFPADGVPRWTNRAIALTVLGVMGLMAAAGLVLALATVSFRRANDYPKTNPDDDLARIKIIAPANLGGLGYLPPDTGVVVGVHVAEALQDPAGREFLKRFRPGDFLPRNQADLAESGLGNLEKWTGLSLEEVDHAVLGLNLEKLIPRLTLVVQTRRSYDAEKVRAALKASRSADPGKRVLYRFELEKIAQKPVVWFAGERTLVVAQDSDDLNAVPADPRPGSEHLSPALRGVLQRMGPAAPVWLAGHSDDWDKTTLTLLLAGLKPADRQVLKNVRTFAAWLQFGDGLRLNAALDCSDAASAEALERYLVPEERKPIALFGNRPEAEAVAKELAQTLKAVRGETWLTLQAKTSAETHRRMEKPK
jgi:hypothetical protein